jgi:ABC-type uncharacterized transport system permease subunit
MIRFRAYWQVLKASAREDGANPKRLISAVLQLVARVWLIIAIYKVAYAVNPHPGLSFQNAMWSIGIYFAFVLALGLRNIARVIDVDVQNGNIEGGLIKPLDWRLFKLSQMLGKSTVEFLIQMVILPLTLFLFVGLPDLSYLTPGIVAGLTVLMVLSVITVTCLFMMVGLSAIWLNDAMPMFRMVDKMAAIFTGAFVPIALLPHTVQEVLRWSPFGIYAAPQQFFNPGVASVIVPTFISGLIWTAIMLAACQFMWTRVARRIEVNGG